MTSLVSPRGLPPAIVLSAGDSTRMGSPKALLATPEGVSFVAQVVRTLDQVGITPIIVVTGHQHERIAPLALSAAASVQVVRNPDPSQGQLSSLLVGMAAAVAPDTPAILVTLVDVPLVSSATVQRVIEAWQRTRAPIVRPAIGDRHGHPVIFDRSVFDDLRRAPLDAGAKTVVRAHADRIVNVPVNDSGCLVDVDTPADYARLRRGGT